MHPEQIEADLGLYTDDFGSRDTIPVPSDRCRENLAAMQAHYAGLSDMGIFAAAILEPYDYR